MVDATAFEPGRNLAAVTPGKVVLRNRLIELIQYTHDGAGPSGADPDHAAVDQQVLHPGHAAQEQHGEVSGRPAFVFMVSWKNPDASMEDITFEDYMNRGRWPQPTPCATSPVQRHRQSGRILHRRNAAGDDAGISGQGRHPVRLGDLHGVDAGFQPVGDSAFFMDEPQIDFIEQQMMERGYLDSREMANMFNLLRSNDLIWSNVVNNYLLGGKPPPSTCCTGTATAPAWRGPPIAGTCATPMSKTIYAGKIQLGGVPIDLGNVKVDIYAVGAEKDHIVPWNAAWKITQLTGGKVRFVAASSGHIAGIINHPAGKKGVLQRSRRCVATPEEWLEGADKQPGSCGLTGSAGSPRIGRRQGPGAEAGKREVSVVCDAPGTYVLEK